jgi:hypothetical protein
MQFQVPQFIETEDKVVGPLTFKQFLYLAGAAALSAFFFFFLKFWLWLILTILAATIALALAFVKINGRPMIVFLLAVFESVWRPKVYVFRPEAPKAMPQPEKRPGISLPQFKPPKISLPALQPPSFGSIRGLWQRLAISKTAIPKREKPLPPDFGTVKIHFDKRRYEIVRRLTGEREVARRVDYR